MSSEPDEAEEVYIGPHKVCFLPPDVIRVWWNGEGTLDDVRALFALSERWCGEGAFFVLADQSRMTNARLAARKVAVTDPRTDRIGGLVVLGASFQMRVLMTMMSKALSVLSRGKNGRMAFVTTEAEAFAWIDAERTRLGLG